MQTVSVTCPACFENFEVMTPYPNEVPCDVDYDCEVCCRPMRIAFDVEDDEVYGMAYGLDD